MEGILAEMCPSPIQSGHCRGTIIATRTWVSMANNKNRDERQPGELPDGKFHYNPGNMSGKKPGDGEQTEENRGDTSPASKEKPAG
jgi:hypothetical protein